MKTTMIRVLLWFVIALLVIGPEVVAQTSPDTVPADVFLPAGNLRKSEPGVERVYKTDDQGRILPPDKQPSGYPRTVDPDSYVKMPGEQLRRHDGTDYSSRDRSGQSVPQDFQAGVYGTVIDVRPGIIKIEIDAIKNRVEYLHNSRAYVKKGDEINPQTRLGETGNINPETGKVVTNMAIHLHVQAKSKNGSPLNPDQVVTYARKPLNERRDVQFFAPMGAKKPIPSFSASDYDGPKDGDFYYEVWGTSTREPGHYRPWSEPFETMQAAKARFEEIKRDHAAGGLLESDPDKPLKLEIRKTSREGKSTDDGPLTGKFWVDSKLGLRITFFADGTFSSTGKGHTLEGTWSLTGNAFSATLPDENRFVAHMQGELQGDAITYRYYVTHPEKGRSGLSDTQALNKQP